MLEGEWAEASGRLFSTWRAATAVQALAVESKGVRAHALERRVVLRPHLAVGEGRRRHLRMSRKT